MGGGNTIIWKHLEEDSFMWTLQYEANSVISTDSAHLTLFVWNNMIQALELQYVQ